jgi:hypothetical protein
MAFAKLSAGTNRNIINTGRVPLKLSTLYAPPNHRDAVVHHTRADTVQDNEHFDGKTTDARNPPPVRPTGCRASPPSSHGDHWP